MINQYPAWKYVVVAIVLVIGTLYALPNIYGKRPSILIKPIAHDLTISKEAVSKVKKFLDDNKVKYSGLDSSEKQILIYFTSGSQQIKAATLLERKFIQNYVVAQTLIPDTPQWLRSINGRPMNLGLDLQGGVYTLMDVDLETAIKRMLVRKRREFKADFGKRKIYRRGITLIRHGLRIRFQKEEYRARAEKLLAQKHQGFELTRSNKGDILLLDAVLKEKELKKEQEQAIDKNIQTLRRRVNELGVTEPVITRQGTNRIVIQLPGVQDPAKVKEILDKEATLQAHGVDERSRGFLFKSATPPIGTSIYYDKDKNPILLKSDPIWTGENVKNAAAGFSSDKGDSSPAVIITLDADGGQANLKYSSRHVGKPMSIVFITTRPDYVKKDGKDVRVNVKKARVINTATIRSQLYKRFEITGLDSTREAQDLALFLRSGSLAAPVKPAESRTIGPSLGSDNVARGLNSVLVGFALVLLFMLIYYRFFGLVANIALLFNLVLLVSLLSMLQATLTLPGIAGIVLTVGMAVDANVLIFERIREELRVGNSPQASIHAGYEKAFSTIFDANITTFIAAVVLFGIGSGPVRGFAVTLSLGIITSMFTAIMVSRAIVNAMYGGRKVRTISI